MITGFTSELLDRLPREAVLGPPEGLWGATEPQVVDYWKERHNAFQGVVTWSPTVDPEMLKLAYLDLVLDKGVKLLLHAWGVAVIQDGHTVRGVIFESKSGRQALLADVVIDTTGDGDIFALAGAPFEMDTYQADQEHGEVDFVIPASIHDRTNISCRWGGVDIDHYRRFRREQPDAYQAIMERGKAIGVVDRSHSMPRNDVALFMAPKLSGYSCLNVEDLTAVEIEGRRRMMRMLDFYRQHMPGFAQAWVLDTSPQLGTRHSRRLAGVKKMVRAEWAAGMIHADEVGVSPSPNRRFPNVSVPLGCLVPIAHDHLLAAGRNLSSDPTSHAFMREVPQCWLMGQAAGVAAAVAVYAGVRVRDVDIHEVRNQLAKQGVYLHTSKRGKSV